MSQQTQPAPYQQRVIDERYQLAEKLNALSNFLNTAIFLSLPQCEQTLLTEQKGIMGDYLSILEKRISRFTKECNQ
ncbi:crAss001_48 related protein [Serratia silvae]|uniref:crAss001_48 related protein n=1 Tax=Serratia silvae TaxID=2824122 RepID=UPI0035CCD3B2